MKHVIGVVGENGAGKDTFTTFLTAAAAPIVISKVHFSDILYETLTLWGIDATRSNLQNLAIAMDREFGKGSVTAATSSRIEKTAGDIIVVEGVRWKTDATMIRSFKNSLLVYITALPKVRFERMKNRREKVGEENLSFEQFEREEKAATELEISEIGSGADFKIENNETLDDLRIRVEELYSSLLSGRK